MNENTVRVEITTLIPFPTKEGITKRQIDNRVERIMELERQEKELAKQRKALENELTKFMDASEELKGKKYWASFKTEAYNPFDSKLFAEKHPRLWKKFHKTGGTRQRFRKGILKEVTT